MRLSATAVSPFKLLFTGVCARMRNFTQERSIKRWEPAPIPMQGPQNTGLCGTGLLDASKCWPSYLVSPESWKLPQACGQSDLSVAKRSKMIVPTKKYQQKKSHGDNGRAWNQTPPGSNKNSGIMGLP